MHKGRNFFQKAMGIGIDGYVLKEEADTTLNSAIRAVLKGKTCFSTLIA
jgi:DNA-binding NarL/FixJ family response regulator